MSKPTPSAGPSAGSSPPPPHWKSTLWRSWRRRCPRCGAGPLFESFFRLHRDCSTCGLVYRPEEGGMTGQMYLSAAVTELVGVVLAAGLWFGTDWSVWLCLGVSVPFILVFSFWFLPKAMGLWVAVDYLTDRHDEKWTPQGPRSEAGSEPAAERSQAGGDGHDA